MSRTNTISKAGIAGLLVMLIAISCSKENGAIKSQQVDQSIGNTLKFKIGQRYGGGIIFYIDSTGQHGLIADTVNLKTSKWWNGVYVETGATKTNIGAGKKNTEKIVLAQGNSVQYAALRCWNYKGSGYKDWYLPSKDELNELYKRRNIVPDLPRTDFWSSSESGLTGAWAQFFTNGFQSSGHYKHGSGSVRAIRSF